MTMRDRNKPLPPPGPGDPLTAHECFQARELLGWSIIRLASEAGISEQTIRTLERGTSVRRSMFQAVRDVLEKAGVEFINEEALGVRLRPKSAS